MSFEAVIFDLDGTLADTLHDIADSMNYVLVENGYAPHHSDAYRYFVGNGIKNLVVRSLPAFARTDAVIEKCHSQMTSYYSRNCLNKTRLYDGIPCLLDALSTQGIRLATLSNKANALTQKICFELLKKWSFDAIIGASEKFQPKPNPAAALYIARKMKIMTEKIAYLGDSDVDMKTAIAAGFYPVGVAWGFRPAKELIDNGAERIINHPSDLLRVI